MQYLKSCGKISHRLVEHITHESVGAAEVIVMPCHVASHWVLLVANLKKQNWDFYDSMSNPTHRLRVVEGLPTQDTGNDCGIFVMKYMEASVVEGPVDCKSHQTWGKDMPRIRAELVASFCRIFQSSLLKENGFNF
ncbi:hypothetical protein KSP40_PGU005861 [Platanthera guangdongensis]|uniref:Ubiquitin-like protease family profile domain-containing protein n=1 Tax=Platanthera guangdongensis TaxID=2320717 RepID=A0ABR2M0X8_9ASPA